MVILLYVWNFKTDLFMKSTRFTLLILLLVSGFLSAQKPPLDESAYDIWKSISSPVISEDGRWITYEITPQQGDAWLYIYDVTSGRQDSIARGRRALFSPDSKYFAYQVIPSYSETRQAKVKKYKEDKIPKNDLEIRNLPGGEVTKVLKVKSFAIPEKNSYWMAYLLEKETKSDNVTREPEDTTGITVSSSKTAKATEAKGTGFVIYNPVFGQKYEYEDVIEYVVAPEGNTICLLQGNSDTTKIDNYKITTFDTRKEISKTVFEGKGSVKKLSSDRTGDLISFIYSSDTSEIKIYSLWFSKNLEKASKIIDSENPSMPSGWSVSENGNITFSDDGTRIFFNTAKKPVKEPVDTLLEEEKYKLDIWSWDDDLLQPMQKKQLEQERKRSWLSIYHIDQNLMIQLADTIIPSIRTYQKGNNVTALGSSDLKYRKSSSWEGRSYTDYYIVNTNNGRKTLAIEKCPSRAYLSPSCKYFLYWDIAERGWISIPVNTDRKKNLTSQIEIPFYDELNDVPNDPSPHGIAGWMDDEQHVLVYDRYDIWSLDLNGIANPINITNHFGRKNNLRLRYTKLDPEADFINMKDLIYLSAFDYASKESGFYTLNPGKVTDPVMLVMGKVTYSGDLTKAKNADLLIWQRGTFDSYPDLYLSNMNFNYAKRISLANPQQGNYNWGSAELVEWMSFDRQKLQGIIYKPEDFDTSKKYPMITYFYERSSDGLYNYISPAPSPSRINISFAVSNGYIVFVPDIPYTIGYPGQSCYNAVVSGTYSLLDKYDYIDRDRLGLDGQSWGGYQIAWLVTQTDLFACAYAGAAVVNMISAYGGIRWGTGMSRMFQYEHTQSRIGGTLWDKPVHFIENSPIFFVPKINSPLLLMHNDADGAVPWYQSIEFITALRRLEKPAWLLSYNDDDHNLVRRANRKDISIRKMQFFDHYLKGTPMPYWMKYGISQLEKGKLDGYDLINE